MRLLVVLYHLLLIVPIQHTILIQTATLHLLLIVLLLIIMVILNVQSIVLLTTMLLHTLNVTLLLSHLVYHQSQVLVKQILHFQDVLVKLTH